jgi:hypothetical protein
MRLSSHNTVRRIFFTGTATLVFGILAVTLSVSESGATTRTTSSGGNNGVVVAADRGATTGSSPKIAAAVSSVVRTGATAATATVLGGAAATGASAAALPDSNDANAALIMAGTLLALTGMAAYVLLRASAKDRQGHHHK